MGISARPPGQEWSLEDLELVWRSRAVSGTPSGSWGLKQVHGVGALVGILCG